MGGGHLLLREALRRRHAVAQDFREAKILRNCMPAQKQNSDNKNRAKSKKTKTQRVSKGLALWQGVQRDGVPLPLNKKLIEMIYNTIFINFGIYYAISCSSIWLQAIDAAGTEL